MPRRKQNSQGTKAKKYTGNSRGKHKGRMRKRGLVGQRRTKSRASLEDSEWPDA